MAFEALGLLPGGNAGAISGMAMEGRYAGLSRPSMAFEALGLLPGGNAGAFSGVAMDGRDAGLFRPSMAFEALGLLPGGNAGAFFGAPPPRLSRHDSEGRGAAHDGR